MFVVLRMGKQKTVFADIVADFIAGIEYYKGYWDVYCIEGDDV